MAYKDSESLCDGMISSMLSDLQKEEFWERGFTKICAAVKKSDVERIAESLWRKLAKSGIRKDLPDSWDQSKPKKMQSLSKTAQFDSLFEDVGAACLDTLLGKGKWAVPTHWGQVLLSLPTDQEWFVPNKVWHLDLPQTIGDIASPGAQLFVCIEDVTTKCGATVVAAGSHQLISKQLMLNGVPDKSASSFLQKQLASKYDWFRQLREDVQTLDRDEYLLKPTQSEDGVQLQVQELTGNQGDMILTHPYLLHAPAPNIGPNVRLAVTQRVYSMGSR